MIALTVNQLCIYCVSTVYHQLCSTDER